MFKNMQSINGDKSPISMVMSDTYFWTKIEMLCYSSKSIAILLNNTFNLMN